jgi:UDP-N-acetylglucosamine--N-acetylmuramyl-(pentapeptide) pyrophosphoryl-undecaprenol N-acetylglucosamine transferase
MERAGRSVLAVCSGGGHLKQLSKLIRLIPDVGRVDWLTYDTGLGRQLVESAAARGDRVAFAPSAAPRDVPNLLRDAAVAVRMLARHRYDLAISTGGAIALPVLPITAAVRIPTVYIESATRSHAPSTTGRVLQYVPGVRCLTQYRSYAGSHWDYVGSVFDEYEPGEPRTAARLRRILVTVGTNDAHPFASLLGRVAAIADPAWEVTWQVGASRGIEHPPFGRVVRDLSAAGMEEEMRRADVVISHAGTGTALTAFELGICPVLVPRRSARHEHVDDHQTFTVDELARRGLALGVEVEDLDRDVLFQAARRTVRRRATLPPLPI